MAKDAVPVTLTLDNFVAYGLLKSHISQMGEMLAQAVKVDLEDREW